MMTDESVLEWASGWVENTADDPNKRGRFVAGLRSELSARADRLEALQRVADAAKYIADNGPPYGFIQLRNALRALGESDG